MDESIAPGAREFHTTRWSMVLDAQRESDATRMHTALASLCRDYWYPLYAFVRRRGHASHDAQDLTQAFFADLLERQISGVDPSRGKFRSYLLGALKHFLANDWHRSNAQKRGGGRVMLEWDALDAESRFSLEPTDALSVEAKVLYDRRWALQLLDTAMAKLSSEFDVKGEGERFAVDKGGWDAYEAPQGRALVYLAPQSQSWSTVRHWLHDLAQELDAAMRDGTLPRTISLAHVWLTADGRAVLLDDPWQDHAHGVMAQEDDVPHAVSTAEDAERFLSALSQRLLDPATTPLYARDFLAKLSSGAMDRLSFVLGNLQSLMSRPSAVTLRRRLASMTLLPAFLAVSVGILGFALWDISRPIHEFQAAHPEHKMLPIMLNAYEGMHEEPKRRPKAKMEDAARLVAWHRQIIEAPDFDEITAELFTDEQRKLARSAVQEFPNVTEAEYQKAEAGIGKRMRRVGMAPHEPWLLFYVAGVTVVFAAVVNLVCVALFGTSPGLRMFGIALVNRRGEPARRMRLLWRSAIAWVPLVLLLVVCGATHQHEGDVPQALFWSYAVLFGLWTAAAVWATLRPSRGLHDWMSGTRLVPR